MSLLHHLVRATLSPERAAQPALPQQFANWSGSGGDDAGWSEEPDTAEAPAPLAEAALDYQSPVQPRAIAPEPRPKAASPRDVIAEIGAEPGTVARKPSPPRPVPQQAVEAIAETQPAPVRRLAKDEPPPQVAPDFRSALQQNPEADQPLPQTPRGKLAEPVERLTPAVVRSTISRSVLRAAEAKAAAGRATTVAAAAPQAIIPPIERPLIERPPRLARRDPAAPVDARALPSVPDRPRDRPWLEEPQVATPVARRSPAVPAPHLAAPPVMRPDATPPAVIPMLAAPQVVSPAPAAGRPQLPDVHISIGRVEVRAAAAPPRPVEREPRGKTEPLSLEAYLNRRNGAAR